MTTYNKQTLATFFQDNDVPAGSDFSNLIDSQVNIVETSVQAMGGALSTTELITPRVSAVNLNVTGVLSANSLSISTLTLTTITGTNGIFSGAVSANSLNATFDISGATLSLTGKASAASVNVTGDVSAATGTIYASAMRSTNGLFAGVGIVSAAGTTQAAATILTNVINRGQGVADGATTGFAIPANRSGLVQYLLLETNTSANLWPPTGGTINGKATNTVFALAGQTSYTIFHVGASAYGVK